VFALGAHDIADRFQECVEKRIAHCLRGGETCSTDLLKVISQVKHLQFIDMTLILIGYIAEDKISRGKQTMPFHVLDNNIVTNRACTNETFEVLKHSRIYVR
jgi:hypothetical protein